MRFGIQSPAGTRIKVIALARHSAAMFERWWWKRLNDVATIYKVVALPMSVVATGATLSRLYQYWNPKGYAGWYFWNVAAARFQEPSYNRPWVENNALQKIIQEALRRDSDERMTLISGLRMSGKTSAVLKECHDQGKVGFFLSLGEYQGEQNKMGEIKEFVVSSLISNGTGTIQGWFQWLKWLFFPEPRPDTVWQGLKGAFKANPHRLVIVVDETQVLANKAMHHGGILNEFCALSPFGSVVLIASEYAVAQHLKEMTHIAERTRVIYPPTPTAEEMRPHIRHLFEERFGSKVVDEVARRFDGSFKLVRRLKELGSVEGVRKWHRQQLVDGLELTEGGMTSAEKATRTGQAMIAAAKMSFGLPVEAFDKYTLELAQAGAAKIETVEDDLVIAKWATPLSEEIMKELVCDTNIFAFMKKRVPQGLILEFEQVIQCRCPVNK